ncbi:hypothetical protein RhiirA4_428374 [Rhizophagus irregularis]|uniref:Uncharacterized protein n=1 Tax=Rhizophagus irregularis TaxID=588596 RepID=A0A2I1HCJ7_9GLOM|nr:hypothetical protein RhiirA4_428374 [Rhizophagus irregularis]
MANNFTRKADFTRTIINVPKVQFKDLGSFSYKNKDTNEFKIRRNIIARFKKDEEKDVSRLFLVDNNGRNLSNSIVLDSENNQIKANIYPAETGPVSYKINWAQDYRVLFIINRHNSLFMRVRAMNPKWQAVSRFWVWISDKNVLLPLIFENQSLTKIS